MTRRLLAVLGRVWKRPLTMGLLPDTMSLMSTNEIDPKKIYTTTEVSEIVGLTKRHVSRLVDDGYFKGSYRKSPVPGSPRQIPGSAVIQYLEERDKTNL